MLKRILLIVLLPVAFGLPQGEGVNLDTVKAQRFDMGRMWTFENPPLEYFKEEYNFAPPAEWFDKVRKSSLRFGGGCSASFVSEGGLIMTNHHCVRGMLPSIQKEGEDVLKDGFYAESFEDERRVPNLTVQQLMVIEDVTDKIKNEVNAVEGDEAKIQKWEEVTSEIVGRYQAKGDGLNYRVVSLYNGGRYSLYGYKIYDDVRMVFAPDLRTAKLGGDYDNFTYPRHGLDCAFLRVYENGEPVKTEYYFNWSDSGAAVDEPIFVVGNPGSTDRIKTAAQIEYDRDIVYPAFVTLLQDIYDVYLQKVMDTGASDYGLIARLYSIGNTLKVYRGMYEGLLNPVLMARKRDFEKQFREKVSADPSLKEKYSGIWDELSSSAKESAEYYPEMSAYVINPFFSSLYTVAARDLYRLANELQKPEEDRGKAYKQGPLNSTISSIFPEDFDHKLQRQILAAQVKFWYEKLGSDNKLLNDFLGGRRGSEAVNYIINNSSITTRDGVMEFAKQTPEQMLNSDDILFTFIKKTQERLNELREKNNALAARESVLNSMLGEALYKVYGETIPPDATGTLRISDGVIKSYPYNGTIAPPHTTFYGMLEKYYAFNKQFPFNLPPIWENLPDEFDLSTPLDFISTNDIIGGNSGSPVINRDGEIVGLAFDGNYESLPNAYIYTTEANRTISVHSMGMIEGIRDLYNAKRLSDELLGKD